MKAETTSARFPVISPLIENDPFCTRMREHQQSIVHRAYELFKDSGFGNRHDLEVWQKSVSELLLQVPIKVTETDYGIRIRAEVLGFTEEDVEVRVDRHRVFIGGRQEKASISEDEKDESVCAERSTKEFYSESLLPADIDPKKVTAELKDGVLEIRLPKSVKSIASTVLCKTA
jgi:HSP20 family protein